ncbi:HD-GYP domain-containing protein [Sphingomonas sp. HF-S4]|uniref:HD-GYP domain-containing protein n=1 Tax=Sphingomonas agrestis TaxID=3080540 RepID=A0ABU3Y9F7_9SPHN|nr:HD-GYP domain-containing protein [Sphingomonas sp. HF-S4]MDV3458058.1 HD-GYP domain-containing protein [Sphingomonas sp. HF-S4]
MLQRIAPSQVKIGMYIHGFEGSWFSHPFWRTRFLLERPEDLAAVLASDVPAVLIDVERGLPALVPETPRASVSRVQIALAAGAPVTMAPRDVAKADREEARKTIARSKRVMKGVFDGARLGDPVDAEAVMPVVEDISAAVDRNPGMFIDMARLKSKDEYTYMHSVSVCALMVNLARQIGLDEDQVRSMGLAGLLHDVGKMAVPDEVLNKPGRLTEEEFALIRAHPEQGHAMLEHGEGVTQEVLDVSLLHHEKVDGSGYPYGLKGDAISLAARMGAICDVYDALTSDRQYKQGWTPLKAATEMHGWQGHFDRDLLFKFFRGIGVVPTGLLVRMRSNRLGIALPDGGKEARSKVRVFHCALERVPLTLEDVFLCSSGGADHIVSEEDPDRWGFADWGKLSEQLIAGRIGRA